jgi:hypothetical protein
MQRSTVNLPTLFVVKQAAVADPYHQVNSGATFFWVELQILW